MPSSLSNSMEVIEESQSNLEMFNSNSEMLSNNNLDIVISKKVH